MIEPDASTTTPIRDRTRRPLFLTHIGESGANFLELVAKLRRRKAENLTARERPLRRSESPSRRGSAKDVVGQHLHTHRGQGNADNNADAADAQ
ncbi:hypothetical protein [Nocardia abscessus]|uniref:hypothetical protein n=1 Tax=Nocardia abscessus TaxID=120957 RepID=UPI0024564DD0|nr:hypothetical protein [Nocardia abscessus]